MQLSHPCAGPLGVEGGTFGEALPRIGILIHSSTVKVELLAPFPKGPFTGPVALGGGPHSSKCPNHRALIPLCVVVHQPALTAVGARWLARHGPRASTCRDWLQEFFFDFSSSEVA